VERKLESYADFCVRKKTTGSVGFEETNTASNEDLLLNDSKDELEDGKDTEVQPTKKVLKIQENIMKI